MKNLDHNCSVYNNILESVGVPTDSTAEGELLPRGGVFHMQGTLLNIQWHSLTENYNMLEPASQSTCSTGAYLGSHRALRELRFGNVSNSLEVIVAGVTEVSGAEAEEDSHRAAVSALVFQVVRPVLGAHLGLANITAASTDELLWVVGVGPASLQVTPSFATKVSLAALETHVVGISVHSKTWKGNITMKLIWRALLTCWIIEPPSPVTGHSLTRGQPLVLQPHQGLLPHVPVQGVDRVQESLQGRMGDLNLNFNVI